jgi:hypothetical protein
MTPKDLEKYSSAFTLSDMEIFIFPELLYALVLANIMSPKIWAWRDDSWFAGIDRMSPLKKVHRVKQYIMDHYNFNLDLGTWGLTDKQTEINRFSEFLDPETLHQSNALFGYEGDKYYFDLDIRRHFGLDKYDSDIIPYWKTETVEAMDAFSFKDSYSTGAGECVSLACLYAAALFIVAKIPLEKIYLMGTPLHSQNFILVDDGVLTNNRRILTKQMWFNGTELSTLARRALEHERVTVVAHSTGWIHQVYPEASISEESYHLLREKLTKYLETNLTFEIFINFLRVNNQFQKIFDFTFLCMGSQKYIPMEKAFGYEHGSKNRLGDKTARKLMCEIEEEDLSNYPSEGRIGISADDMSFTCGDIHECIAKFREMHPGIARKITFFEELKKYVHTVPQLPSANKFYGASYPLNIPNSQTREEITGYLAGIRKQSLVADLAFYAGRHMDSCDWAPFLKAAFERNPVSIDQFREDELPLVFEKLNTLPGESIYSGNRLAQPDEVVNFSRGDGIEKAICLANVIASRNKGAEIILEFHSSTATVKWLHQKFSFHSLKSYQVTKTWKSL